MTKLINQNPSFLSQLQHATVQVAAMAVIYLTLVGLYVVALKAILWVMMVRLVTKMYVTILAVRMVVMLRITIHIVVVQMDKYLTVKFALLFWVVHFIIR